MCIVHLGARAVNGVLKPLRLAGAADMTSSHNGGFILPTVKRLQRVKVRLRGPVSYDDPRCQPPARSSRTCSAVNPLCNARTVGGIRSLCILFFFLSFRMFSHTHCSALYISQPLSLSLPPSPTLIVIMHTQTPPRLPNPTPLLIAHLTPETSEPWEGQMADAGWGGPPA